MGRKLWIAILWTSTLLLGGNDANQTASIHYGKVLSIHDAGGYRYLEVDENGTTQWVAVMQAPVEVGDRIGFDTRTVMTDFQSKALKKTFKRIIFAQDLYLPKHAKTMPGSLKAAVMEQPALPEHDDNVTDDSDFVEKPMYTVEEVHRWRKRLNGRRIKVKGKVYKVARGIMKRDWVHIGDGTGNEHKLTDDLVFTAQHVTLRHGDTVIAEGNVTVERNFGFGYFYDVLIEGASFSKNNLK